MSYRVILTAASEKRSGGATWTQHVFGQVGETLAQLHLKRTFNFEIRAKNLFLWGHSISTIIVDRTVSVT